MPYPTPPGQALIKRRNIERHHLHDRCALTAARAAWP